MRTASCRAKLRLCSVMKRLNVHLLDAYKSGRIPHAWLIGGPPGIGKATLAFRLAQIHVRPSRSARAGSAKSDIPCG